MNKLLKVILLSVPLFSFAEVHAQGRVEMPDTQVIPIKDSQSKRQYELLIKLPENYAENTETKYPVLYFTDAVWHIELMSASTFFLMEDVILVGISWQKDNDPKLLEEVGEYVSRFRDYSISQSDDADRQAKYQFGDADSHLAFIRQDVMTYVDNNYRTDPQSRTYFGYSLGGLFGAYALLTQPDLFDNYMLGSPSVWRFSEIEAKANKDIKSLKANVFVTYGSEEDKLSKHVDDFLRYLEDRKDSSLSVKHVVIDGTHQTAAPTTGVSAVAWLASLHGEKE